MARAATVAWMGMTVGIWLVHAGGDARAQAPADTAPTADAAIGQPSRVRTAMRTGVQCYQRGDYERAATYFQQAQAGQDDLGADERKQLAQWLELNRTALQARRDGASQLRQADEALKKGQTQVALGCLKAVAPNKQFLAAEDKQKLQQLNDQLLPVGGGPAGPGTGDAQAMARSKLKQARLLLTKGNYDAAQALAVEADRLGAHYSLGEDTPKKVLTDIDTARTPSDAKGLLAAARAALAKGDLDRAEQLAKRSDKASSVFTFSMWGDSPSKVLKEVQAERTKQQQAKKNTPVSGGTPPSATLNAMKPFVAAPDAAAGGDSTEAARRLLKDARAALKAGNAAQAGQMAERARALKPVLSWWEDNPDKVLADVRQADGVKDAAQPKTGVATAPVTDPHALLKQARGLYETGKYDEADKLAQKANAAPSAHWGLFEDSPDKLLADLRKARFKRDQEESARVLVEARKQYDQGHLAEAEKLAHRAQALHGPYSVWDLGDRPSKLLADVDTAKSKQHGNPVPPTAAQVVRTDTTPPAAKPVAPPPAWPTPVQRPTDTTTAGMPAPPAPYLARPGPGAADGTKAHAQELLAESRQLLRGRQLLEARARAVEAQRLGASFGPGEDSPEQALLAAGAVCQRRIDELLQEAGDYAATAEVDPNRVLRADQDLRQARQLAVGFGFDTRLIDTKVAWVQQLRDKMSAGVAPVRPPALTQIQHQEGPVAVGPGAPRGRQLLDQARMELRAGKTDTARKLAEAAFDPQFGVQAEAGQVLRSIDAEEFNQRGLTANRSFDAGVAAYNRREYTQAAAIFRGVDPQNLERDRQERLRLIMATAEMQPSALAQVSGLRPAAGPGAGRAVASDLAPAPAVTPEADFAKQVLALQEVKFQEMRNKGMEVQRDAMKAFQAGDTDRALELLGEYTAGLTASGLDADRVAMLRRPIESRYQSFKTVKAQRDFEKLQVSQLDAHNREIQHGLLAEEEKHKQVAELMKQYNAFYRDGKYQDAQMVASRAKELDPDNPAATAGLIQSKMAASQAKFKGIKDRKEDMVLSGLDQAEDEGPAVDLKEPLKYDVDIAKGNRDRKPIDILQLEKVKNEREREIYRKLDGPVSSLDFKDTPLQQVLDDLAGWTGMNIVPDRVALGEAGISLDRPVTMKLEGVALKSALNLLLHQVHLTYVVKDEVLQVTTEENARGKLVTRIHPVTDLVIPVPDFSTPPNPVKQAAMGGPGDTGLKFNGAGAPPEGRNALTSGKDVSMSQLLNGVSSTGSTFASPTVTKDNPRGTTEDVLIKLITNTIAPQSWANVGGPGTIDFFPLGMALVINQTPDIQEQVAELLAALRRLQDQEVAVEIRFITIAEAFYERIGLDFNINIRNDQTKYEPQIVSQQFKPFGFINHFTPNNFIAGLTPAGAGGSSQTPGQNFTQDLNIPLHNSSFGMAIPPFGDFPNAPGANGGLSFGLAFLSDIEVFLFMEAAQGDIRTNVMQAPKLTMFNGQTATLTVTDQQFFTTGVTVAQVGGQVVFVPQNNPFPTGGVTLTLNSIISADRRFVRLSVVPTLTNLASANVPLFPITTFITPIFEGGAVGQPVPFTQFLQQPTINTITVNTTVNVPDGGTVLIGGLKRLSEGRNEFGPPILSKIPYLNRLFKNVGYGREAESLLMMVTPRIIINEEEELRQVPGAQLPPGGGQ